MCQGEWANNDQNRLTLYTTHTWRQYWGHTNAKRARLDPIRPGQNGLFEFRFGGARKTAVRTFRLTFPLPQRPKPCSAKRKKGRKTYRNPIIFAREWEELRTSKGWSQVDLARHFGVSEARVSQVFQLLKLAPEAQRIIAEIGDNLTYVAVKERDLRAQVKSSMEEQVAYLESVLGEKIMPSRDVVSPI